jgi:1-phosphofructokinase
MPLTLAGPDGRPPRLVVFGPSPLLSVTVERRGGRDDIHLHPAGQGVWASRMAGELGAWPVLCGLSGGETGVVLERLLERLPGERRLVATASPSGAYLLDRRAGERRVVACAVSDPPTRHEVDDLISITCAAALEGDALLVCNPLPGDALPPDVYPTLVADGRAGGAPVLVDLSSPRLESALEARPDVVKLNDWELAEFVAGPVDGPRLRRAAEAVRARGAAAVLVTRGPEPALVLRDGLAWELVPPRFERGAGEGCGDSMMGALAAALAAGRGWEESLVLGAAAGAANFLRHGLGSSRRPVVEQLAERVELRRLR